jgi:hypothetical protein
MAMLLLGAPACEPSPTDPTSDPSLKINALKMYTCAAVDGAACVARGNLIPADSLPPRSEHFEVWAYYDGLRTITWRLQWPGGSIEIDKTATDSSHVWLALDGGRAPYYTLKALMVTGRGFAGSDSLRWVFPNSAN